jgi:hypothetical protein
MTTASIERSRQAGPCPVSNIARQIGDNREKLDEAAEKLKKR